MWWRRLLFWLVIWTRLYFGWSKVYRAIWHRRFRGVVLPEVDTLAAAQAMAYRLDWKPDRWRELWDAIADPRAVHSLYLGVLNGKKQPDTGNDCDDFAVWLACLLNPDKFKTAVLSVTWRTGRFISGHNVCVVQHADGYYHLGNWGRFGPYPTFPAVACSVAASVPVDGCDVVGWALYTPASLRLLAWGFGLPTEGMTIKGVR